MYFSKTLTRNIAKVSTAKEVILILGESGVGKRTIAQEIHNNVVRKGELSIIEGLSASDTAFQALGSSRLNRLTVANVDHVSPHNQHLLGRFLKENPAARVVLTAVQSDKVYFDKETFQTLEVPPLRERLEELPELVGLIVGRLCKQFGKPVLKVDESLLKILSKGSWPGNIKELVDVIGKGVLDSHGDNLQVPIEFLNEHQHLENAIQNIAAGRVFVLDHTLDLIELLLLRRALDVFQYNQTNTSAVLGLSEANFRYRLKKFRLPSVRERD